MKRTLIAALAMTTISTGLQAHADCGSASTSGYVYVHTTCTQDPVNNVRNICQTQRGDADAERKAVLIISNVIYDDASNRRYPTSQFFDELKIQHDVTLNGKVSPCYADYDEAVDQMRSQIARWKRRFKDTAMIKQVYMDNS